jgi:hypothetical protein
MPIIEEMYMDFRLVDFLERDVLTPVVCIRLETAAAPTPLDYLNLVITVCETCGCRAVIVAEWASAEYLERDELVDKLRLSKNTVTAVQYAASDWLFPRMDCIIHSGEVRNTACSPLL